MTSRDQEVENGKFRRFHFRQQRCQGMCLLERDTAVNMIVSSVFIRRKLTIWWTPTSGLRHATAIALAACTPTDKQPNIPGPVKPLISWSATGYSSKI